MSRMRDGSRITRESERVRAFCVVAGRVLPDTAKCVPKPCCVQTRNPFYGVDVTLSQGDLDGTGVCSYTVEGGL